MTAIHHSDHAVWPHEDALEARYALRIVSRLNEATDALPHDLAERLRVARQQALERARVSRASGLVVPAAVAARSSALVQFSDGTAGSRWWPTMATALVLAGLTAGLLLIQAQLSESQISAAAEIDAAILSDDLPLDAYGDAGFVEFLKASRNN